MNIRRPTPLTISRWALLSTAVLVTAVGCASGSGGLPSATSNGGSSGGSPATTPSGRDAPATTTGPAESQTPDTGTTSGDVPDNAVFLTYHDPKLGYTIQYVEGWQVSPTADGVAIRDKDSSELVQVVPTPTDVATYVSGTDLAALGQQSGFKLIKQDTVTVKGTTLVHLAYELPSAPDPVTGKQVPSTVDRYYVPGPQGLAIVSLATPNGVDNVDAFRQMIESFRWA